MNQDRNDFVGVLTPNTIYMGVASRTDFDKIERPATDHGEKEDGSQAESKA